MFVACIMKFRLPATNTRFWAVHVGAATNYSVVPLGGVAFNAHDAMQFRDELLTT